MNGVALRWALRRFALAARRLAKGLKAAGVEEHIGGVSSLAGTLRSLQPPVRIGRETFCVCRIERPPTWKAANGASHDDVFAHRPVSGNSPDAAEARLFLRPLCSSHIGSVEK